MPSDRRWSDADRELVARAMEDATSSALTWGDVKDAADVVLDALTTAGWVPPEVGSESAARTSIRAALAEADVTQAELARRLDLSQKHVSQVLSGRAGLSLDMADRMLAAVGRGPLIGGTDAR